MRHLFRDQGPAALHHGAAVLRRGGYVHADGDSVLHAGRRSDGGVRHRRAHAGVRQCGAALMTSASIQGPIIPPSIPMVLVGAVTGTSIGGMLLGGAIPGVMMGLAMAVIVFAQS